MKIKNAAIFLLIASICAILAELYWTVRNFEYYSTEVIQIFIRVLSLTLPIALLFLSIALMNNKKEVISKAQEDVLPESNEQNLSVGDWLVTFLITIIPLVGFIFIIIWANDDKNKIRKNWAVASLIWTGILFVLFIFLYATIFASIMRRY